MATERPPDGTVPTPPDIDDIWDAPLPTTLASNGTHAAETSQEPRERPFARSSTETTPDDLADLQRGMAALARMPVSDQVRYLGGLDELKAKAHEELTARMSRIERLRYDTMAMLESGSGARLGARVLGEMSMDPPPPMLIERLDPEGHTVLFGAGGTGKGLMAAHWTLKLTRAKHRVLILDYENHPDEWARRVYGLGGSDILGDVLHVAPLTAKWGGKRGALWDQADDLRQLVSDWGATYLVIDSIVPACSGTDPLKPEAVSQYAGALELIGCPALSLGHVTKADDLRYPFGSVFWHNLSRVTWSAKRDGEAIVLAHRKHNNYEKHANTRVEITWLDGLPVSVWEREASEELSQRIGAALRGEPRTVTQICDLLDEDHDEDDESTRADSVRHALRRGAKAHPPRFVKIGSDRWSNA